MTVLAFDTSTEAMSIALGDVQQVWQHTAAGGAQASATLIPSVLALMAEAGKGWGDLQAIAFGSGPGAFTGLRTACSVAQGLAFGASLPVLPVDTLLAVAEEARTLQSPPSGAPLQVMALLDARMDEIYAAAYRHDGLAWVACSPLRVARPEDLCLPDGWRAEEVLLAGNVFDTYGTRLGFAPAARRCAALPTATAMLRLAPALLAQGLAVPPEQALPVYIRDKVAQTTSERAALRAAPLSAPPSAA